LPPHSIPSPLPAPTAHLSPLPLHDALPIYPADRAPGRPGTGSTGHRVDRAPGLRIRLGSGLELVAEPAHCGEQPRLRGIDLDLRDRKSTRLNSSHVSISYAVFCLKKKNAAR